MTLMMSATDIKRCRKTGSTDGKPRPGTLLRKSYDDLRTGLVTEFPSYAHLPILRDRYGMEIENIKSDQPGTRRKYRLVGEWHGSDYIPVERIVVSLSEPVS